MDIKDKLIWCTGIVGRAMGSGKFTGADIQALADLAAQAFENTFGKFSEPEPASPPLQTPYKAPSGPERTVPMPTAVLPESKDWNLWKKDACRSFDAAFSQATWEWLLERAKAQDEGAINAIKKMASSDPGDPAGKWFKANARRAARAKAVLLMVG